MYYRWLPYQFCSYHSNTTFGNFLFVQSKAFVIEVMHADISFLHILFSPFLFPNLQSLFLSMVDISSYLHKGQILRMESEHWRLLQSISSWLHYLHQHEKFLCLASHWLYRYACQNVNQNKKSCSSCISKDAYPKNIPQNSRTTSVQFTWAYVVTIHSISRFANLTMSPRLMPSVVSAVPYQSLPNFLGINN